MHAVCPQCSLSYAREPGFFMGAMYFSYALGILAALPLCLYLVIARIPPIWAGLAAVGQLALLSPFLLRYSRVMWLHFDQRFDPR